MIEVPVLQPVRPRSRKVPGRRSQARRRGARRTCSSRRSSCTTRTSGRAPSARGPRRSRRLDPQDVPPEGHRQRPHRRHPQPDQEGRRSRQAEAPEGLAPGHAQEGPPARHATARCSARSRATTFACSTQIKLEQPKTKTVAADVQGAWASIAACLVAINGRNEMMEKSARNIDRTTLTTVVAAQRVGHPAQPHAADDQGRLGKDSGLNVIG